MRKIHLYGDLEEKYGKEHNFECSSIGEALRAMDCAYKGFLNSIRRDGLYKVLKGSEVVNEEQLGLIDYENEDFHIIPIIAGSKDQKDVSAGSAVLGIVLIAVGVVINAYSGVGGNFFISMGVGLLISGLVGLMAPTPKDNGGVEDKSSFLFGSAQNVSEQGGPVPIVYGKIRAGSIIISTSLEAVNV